MTIASKKERQRLATARYRAKPGNRELIKARRNRVGEWEATQKRRSTKEGWAKHVLNMIKWRAKKNGIEFNLSAADIIIPDTCPVLGMPLVLVDDPPQKGNKVPYNRPSIDRFDNSKGYTKENIRVISNRANILKKDATLFEISRIHDYMKGKL